MFQLVSAPLAPPTQVFTRAAMILSSTTGYVPPPSLESRRYPWDGVLTAVRASPPMVTVSPATKSVVTSSRIMSFAFSIVLYGNAAEEPEMAPLIRPVPVIDHVTVAAVLNRASSSVGIRMRMSFKVVTVALSRTVRVMSVSVCAVPATK